ncbi:diguanylate cyclase domain-containing protein [uncultured Pseudokineococcus sp.]|uniref:sensor domain-containing diguanylate cyclase n=1 Tax=uncultured Pseudokineococcus sp. TaxID=1642928 RepID=UPI00261D09C3|nr:diguanylate cyclase [uncultured Pseudokineococcus sp.]
MARSAVFATAFAAAVLAGRLTVMDGTSLSLVWPAAGVAAVWFAVQRRAGTLVLDVAALALITFVLNRATGTSGALAGCFVAANLLQVTLVQALLHRWAPDLWGAGGRRPLTGTRHLIALLGAAAVASAGGALVGVVGAGLLTGQWSALTAAVWLVRNSVSLVLGLTVGLRVGYLATAWRSGRRGAGAVPAPVMRAELPWQRLGRAGAGELSGLLVVSGVAYLVIFDVLQTLPIAFPLLVVTVWAALRFDTTVVALHSLAVGVLAVVFTLGGDGPFAFVDDDALTALLVQAFVGMVAVLALVLALGRDERQVLLGQVRAQAAEADQRTEHARVLAGAARLLHTSAQVRTDICRAAQQITGADLVHLLEPDGAGNITTTASTGANTTPATFALDGEPSLTARAFRTGRAHFLADVRQAPHLSAPVRHLAGFASAAWQPVRSHRQESLGVLTLVWHRPLAALPDHVPPMLETLASEAAAAVEREDLLARLAQAADHDPLTGLVNRRRWDTATATETARARRSGQPLTMAIVDLDHFKAYNDTHGHLAGDELLRAFAHAATAQLRDIDVLARWGGEEFALALPGCTPQQALAVAARIHAAVPAGQTCTIGLARWTPGEDAAQVMRRADAALYAGKNGGRDTTVTAPDPLPRQTRPTLTPTPSTQ